MEKKTNEQTVVYYSEFLDYDVKFFADLHV